MNLPGTLAALASSGMMPEEASAWRFCVAPMMDWTDRHCRFFHRMLSRHARLYTEMVTTGALLHGDTARHLDFHAAEHPVALQLGGSETTDLARAAKLGEQWGYDEINLNCGCPSERVQKGAFGACLMAEAPLVRDCVKAMVDAVALPVTVKHRLGINDINEYGFVRDFVGIVSEAGCTVFIAHARNAVLKGLTPKDNREIPPLKYDYVQRLKQDFAHLTIVVNGGIQRVADSHAHLQTLDGVMLGRTAYHEPWSLAQVDAELFGDFANPQTRDRVAEAMCTYATDEITRGTPLRAITRHILGLYNGLPGARAWRQQLSDAKQLRTNDPTLLLRARPALTDA